MTSRKLKLGEISRNASRSFDFSKNPSVVFVNTGDVLEGEFLHANITNTKNEQLPGQAKKAIKKGDILYSEIRPGNKRYVYIDKDLDNYVVSTKFMVIESNQEIVDSKFLYYCLTEKKCEETFKAIADSRSGTFPQITFDSVSFYEFEIPSKEEQKAFVYIADNIANKIRLINKLNQNLEAFAKTIFKSWFIDFDPVHAKKNALKAGLTKAQTERAAMAFIAGLCSSTEYAENRKEIEKRLEERLASIGEEKAKELEATTTLFPSDFEDSELGPIPSGWSIKTIDDVADVIGGGTPSTSNSEYYCEKGCGIAWLSPKDLSGYNWKYIKNGATDITELGFKKSSARMLPKGSVVISSRAPIGYVAIAEEKLCTNQGFKSLVPKGYVGTDYIYNWAKLNVPAMETVATGSTFQEISGSNMKNLKLVVPDDKLCKGFEDLIKTNSEYQELLRYETRSLEQLRDLLLPKLLSGEINLNNVQIESETR